jgi:hypothetical protein
MLAGRNDAALLNLFVKDFGERFAESDGTIHGAYGYRWRKTFGFDQLKVIIRRLIKNPNDRQCVLQMWDCEPQPKPTNDEFTGLWTNDLLGDYRDCPCNVCVFFRVNDGLLYIAVCCRSNDILMGAYGANAVHFSILQEYMAAMIDVGVGTYTQFSFNYHAYTKDLDALGRKLADTPLSGSGLRRDDYDAAGITPLPLVDDPESFDQEVEALLYAVSQNGRLVSAKPFYADRLHNRFLRNTAWPLFAAYLQRSLLIAEEIEALDWRMALVGWLQRRQKKG